MTTPQMIDTLIHARWVLPIVPRNQLFEHYSIAIDHEKIIAILPTEQAKKTYHAKQIHHRLSHVLMPGLVNTHAHTPMNLLRGLADDLTLMDWLNHHIWPAEQKILCPESIYDGSLLAIAEMIRGGTTFFSDHYFFAPETARAVIKSGIRAALGHHVMQFPSAWSSGEKESMQKAEHCHANRPHSSLITWTMVPHSPYGNTDEGLLMVKAFAEKHDLKIHIHLHETQHEIEMSLKEFKKRPLQRFHELELLNQQLIAVHMVHLTDSEIALCAETGLHVSHNPESNLKLASGFAPIVKLMKVGVNVCLGTDGAASNNDLDMFGELRTASLIAKATSQDPTVLDAFTTLEMATMNGAKALGLEKEIGSLEAGKWADIISVNLDNVITQPIYHPISHLVYAVNRLQVEDVWVAGKQLLNQTQFTELDIESIVEKAKYWGSRADAQRL